MGTDDRNLGGSGAGWSDVVDAAAAPVDGDHPFAVTDAARYRLGATLGVGGMGHVRVAWDRRLRRDVAYKEVRREVAGEAALRLAREAWITAHLEHPGIVPVYDAGRTPDGQLFYTMRLVRGRSLRDALRDASDLAGRLSLVRPFLAVCETTAYAHAAGVVHRDLKPANVMVGPFGEVQVVDWGLARGLDETDEPTRPWDTGDPALTVFGTAIGTPGYMSPEQARGEPADPRADVWALGAMLCELLTGAPPYPGSDTSAIVERARLSEEVDVAGRAPGAPPELVAVCARSLAPPAERYPDAGALAADVARWLDGRRVEAYRYSTWELLVQLVRAWRAPLAVGGVAAAVLAIGGIAAFDRVREERDRARASDEATAVALAESRASLAEVLVQQARTAARAGDRASAERLAVRALALGESPLARGVLARFAVAPPPVRGPSVPLPTCDWWRFYGDVVLCGGDTLAAYALGADAPTWTAPGPVSEAAVVGDRVVAIVDRHVRVLDAATGAERAAGPDRLHAGLDLRVGADGGVSLIGEGRLYLIDPDTAAVDEVHPCGGAQSQSYATADPAGGRWAVSCGDGRVRVGGPRAWVTWDPGLGTGIGAPAALAWVHDRVVIGTGDGRLIAFEPGSGEVRGEAAVPSAVRALIPGSNGLVVAVPERGNAAVWDVHGAAGVVTLPATRPVAVRGATVWTVDDGALTPWELPIDAGFAEYVVDNGVTAAVPSPDRARLAVTSSDHRARVVRVRDGALLDVSPPVLFVHKHAAWAPDGRLAVANAAPTGVQLRDVDGRWWAPDRFVSMRRVGWLSDGTLLGIGYGPGLRVLRPGDLGMTYAPASEPATEPVFFDLDQQGDVVALLSQDGGVWTAGLDGVARRGFDDPAATAVAVDGDTVWIAHRDGVVRYDADGTALAALPATGEGLADVAVSARFVAAPDLDGTVFVWDVATGALRAAVDAHAQRAVYVAFEADDVLITAGWDGRIRRLGLGALDVDPTALQAALDATWGPE